MSFAAHTPTDCTPNNTPNTPANDGPTNSYLSTQKYTTRPHSGAPQTHLKTGFGTTKDLPILGRAQGGEDGNIVLDEHPIDWTYRPADLQGVHGAFAVFVTGESMVPKYKDQDIAYVHPTQPARPGRFVLIDSYGSGGFIKQFVGWENDTLVVQQFNPAKELRFARRDIKSVMLVIGSLDS